MLQVHHIQHPIWLAIFLITAPLHQLAIVTISFALMHFSLFVCFKAGV